MAVNKVLREVVDLPGGERTIRLYRCAEALVSAAENGDVSAMREIGDRIDGKVKQTLEHEVGRTLEEMILGSYGDRRGE